MRGLSWLAGGLLLVGLCGVAAASQRPSPCVPDWPRFQHDLANSGAACTTAVSPAGGVHLSPRWFVPTQGAVTAEPVVSHGRVYVGDGAGVFRAIDAATGTVLWSFDVVHAPAPYADQHAVSYGEIVSSASYADVPSAGPTVFFGGGGSVYALNPSDGKPRWRTDVDPGQPGSSAEVESSPLVWRSPTGVTEVLAGVDTNEDSGGAHGGLVSLDAVTGRLLWKFDAQTGEVATSLTAGEGTGDGCGDVWSSPAVDAGSGRVYIATGNCDHPGDARNLPHGPGKESVWCLDATDGRPLWVFPQPPNRYMRDDDFGSSPAVVHTSRGTLVLEASKAGLLYALRDDGRLAWKTQVAQPGQAGDHGGAIGGVIGAVAVGRSGGRPAVFLTSAVPLPFNGDGPTSGADTSLTDRPARAASLHAVDVATGAVLWDAPLEGPTYAPATYAGGVVFAPSTTGFAVAAYDASDGRPLAVVPSGAAMSSGMSVAGANLFVGAGTYEAPNQPVPPQATGVWSFRW